MSHQYINSKKHLRIDSNNDGIVDDSDKLGNKPADEYMTTDTNQDISGVKTFEAIKLNTTTGEVCEEGIISWNPDDGTAVIGMPGGDVCLNIGQEQFLPRPTNKSGVKITNGTPVYISGAAGANPWVDIADASDQDNNRKTLAIATEDIDNNQKGYCTTFGLVRGVDTDGIGEGDEIFVAVGGGFTNIKPTLPNGVVRVGHCLRQSSEEGVILVSIDVKSTKDILTDSGDLTIKTASGYTKVLEQSVWDDLRITPGTFSFAGVTDPTLRDWQPGGSGATFKTYCFSQNDEVFFTCQMPHTYKEGTNIHPHVHWTPRQYGVAENGETVAWKFDYTWANVSETFPPSVTADMSDTCSGTNDYHEISNTLEIDGTGKKISSMLMCRLYRDTTGDTYSTTASEILAYLNTRI